MFKVFIGIGILATPYSIRKVGVVGGAISIIICGLLNIYTMQLQIIVKEKVKVSVTSYSDLAFAVFGPIGKVVVDICIASS
jgi:amino acid permease